MIRKFILTQPRFEHLAGTVVYEYTGHTYGLVREDEEGTGVPHYAVTLKENGDHPFFTVPTQFLDAHSVTDSDS